MLDITVDFSKLGRSPGLPPLLEHAAHTHTVTAERENSQSLELAPEHQDMRPIYMKSSTVPQNVVQH